MTTQPWNEYLADASAEAQREGARLRVLAKAVSRPPGWGQAVSRANARNSEQLSPPALAFLGLADDVFNARRAEVEAAIARVRGAPRRGLEAVRVEAEVDALERLLRRLVTAHERVAVLVKGAEELVDQYAAEDWMDG